MLREHRKLSTGSDTLILNSDGSPLSLLPISTLSWKKAIPEMWSGNASVLHVYEDWEVRSPSLVMNVPSVMVMRTFRAPKRMVRFNRRNIYIRDGYRCQYCSEVFSYGLLTFDHVIPQSHGGKTTWENIATACGPCNSRRGCNGKIKPKKMPYRPTYWEMAEKAKQYPIIIPHESWLYYLDWSPELITVKDKKK